MMCDELEILNREIERLLQGSIVEGSSLNSESLQPSSSDSWDLATASGNEAQGSLVKAAISSGGLLVSESSGWHQDEHCASDFSRSACAVGIKLSGSDLFLPSSGNSFGLSQEGGKILATSSTVSGVTFENSSMEEENLESVALESESNMENTSLALDDKDEQSNEDEQKAIKPTSKEFKKTWGFRRTTIAKREGLGDAEMDIAEQSSPQQQSLALRRSGRQPKRTERVEEFLTTVRRRGRKILPTALEDLSEPASCHVTDIETASEGSVESMPDVKVMAQKCRSKDSKDQSAGKGRATKEHDYEEGEEETSDSDSDGLTLKELQNRLRKKRGEQKPTELTLKELQNRLRKKHQEQNPTETVDVQAGNQIKPEIPEKQESESIDNTETGDQLAVSQDITEAIQAKKEIKSTVQTSDEPEESKKRKSESEVYDPSTLYCICQQPHNNRFMICCDRCEEWFHGDCVGISEARGRLLERNGEDYICPNCTILQVQDETLMETDQQETMLGQVTGDGTELTSIGTVEQKSIEDQGIKGRIEKAANPSGKKKLKIFQPVVEEPEAANCIGPGCSNMAQSGSVYCGHECILKHAAATMKFLNEGKEQKPKEKTKLKVERAVVLKPQPLAGTKPFSTQKRPTPEKREIIMKKTVVAALKTEANTQTVAKEPTSESSTPSWASDHNYNAVKPEKTPAISSSLLFKSQKEERKNEDKPAESSIASKKIVVSTSAVEKQMSIQTRNLPPKKPPTFTSTSLTKHPIKYSAAGFKGVIPKKSSLSTGPPTSTNVSSTKPSSMSYGTSSVSKKAIASSSIGGGLRKPMVSSASSTTFSAAQAKLAASPSQSQPNSQIRQNIRRSLKEILWKRVNDSDDLAMTESEVGKIALNIEKEMFNLFQATDNRYKSKYRSIMFNLKDPKNQGLFHRVLREDLPLSKLVRMKPEELVSKELSTWKEKPVKALMASRRKSFENKKSATKPEPIPDVNMEDSPPVSDSDEQQEADRAAPEKSSTPILDVFSSMLQDTTSQHRAHLFDLNCKICTGQISASDDEPASKKPRSSSVKKAEPKPEIKSKSENSTPTDDVEAAKELENALESVVESAAEVVPQPNMERTYIPLMQGQTNPETSLPNENSLFPISYSGGIVTTVTVSGKDPRTAMSTVSASASTGASALHPVTTPDKVSVGENKQEMSRSTLPAPKSILTKPSSSDPRYLAVTPSLNVSMSEMRSPQEGDTSLFLSRLNTIWKGFINMQSVAKFVTKAYPVSGSFDYLSEDLPDTIHIGGRISPKTVWDYIGKLKSSVSKELCLIRFHPATEEEVPSYISLYSYFSSRGRFGVVANNNRHVKDLYLIPLSAKDPIPSKLLPFEGPGLESTRPNLILGLVICQKTKRPATVVETEKMEEKRSRIQLQEETETSGYTKGNTLSQQEKKSSKFSLYSGETVVNTSPPGSPPPPPPEPPSAVTPSVLKILSSVKAGNSTTVAPSNVSVSGTNTTAASSTTSSSSKLSTPLDHILQTLFGKKKSFDPITKDSEEAQTPKPEVQTISEEGLPAAPLLDPIVQQFGQMSKDKAIEEEEDDRPYDPEEEYAPERAFEMQSSEIGLEKRCETSEQEDEAYDPEDETILEEAKVTVDDLPNKMYSESKNNSLTTSSPFVPDTSAPPSLVEQQKMLEELNKQIEEQKRQLEEQEEALRQQRAAVGVSMAHFSVSDALMSPPPKSSVAKTELFQHEKQTPEKSELPTSSSQAQQLSQGNDPRQSRDPRQARRILTECNESADSNVKQHVIESSAGQIPPSSYSGSLQTSFDKEDKTLISVSHSSHKDTWVTSEQSSVVSEKDVPSIKSENAPQVHQETINKPVSIETSTTVPVRKVLLPTPPNPCFLPTFSASNNAQTVAWSNESQDNNVPGVARDSFSSPLFTSQEKVPGHFEAERGPSHYEDQRNPQSCHFYEQMESPTIKNEEERGVAPFSSLGQKSGPPLMCGAPEFHGQRGPPQQFTDGHNPPPNNDGQRGPPPNRFGAPRAPIPSLFSAQHGPPPLFGDNRGPSPSFPSGSREMAASQFEDQREPHMEHRDSQYPDSQYHEMTGGPGQFEGPEPPQFMGNRGPSPFPFGGQRRPPPNQFKGQRGGPSPQFVGPRGPPPNHFGGTRGPPPNQFEGQRGPTPGHMPGPRGLLPPPFEERRGSPPPRFPNQRGPAPHQFGGPRGPAPGLFPEKNEPSPNRHNFPAQSQQGMKPTPRPLLDLPSHPPQHRKEMWDETVSPTSHSNTSGQGSEAEAQWPTSDFREGRSNDYRTQAFEGRQRERFEGGNKEKILEQPDQSDNRSNRGTDDRRRDRDHNWAWERDRGRNWNRGRERDWERHKEKDWDKNRERNYNKDRERDSERGKDWERNRDRTRTRDSDAYRRRDRSRSRDRDYDRFRDRDQARSREKEKDRERDRDRDKDRARDRKDRSKSKECDKDSKQETQTGGQRVSHSEAAPSSTKQT
ncbi:death-inducer obliterator 1 isoform X2 [Rhineura floridana]|uniref:death-inducer obliterator 1 isoform X2 n=1 Tax=Rhineura floridana TaxID=261503 RepID=UPI002AC7F32D|nr:death-inducer obliterator 1 isoform X2 [Rhineura floridana]XP_061487022.1 death-inducer obliterator 1 isoform X2 [Rhineura floridana]